MRPATILQNALLGASALLVAGAHFSPDRDHTGPVLSAAVSLVSGAEDTSAAMTAASAPVADVLSGMTRSAVEAFAGVVRPLSRPAGSVTRPEHPPLNQGGNQP